MVLGLTIFMELVEIGEDNMYKHKLILMMCVIGIVFSKGTKVMASTNIQRIGGSDRYDTAIQICKNGWANGSKYAVLASGEDFPDAITATPLAKKYNAPILLNPKSNLDTRVEGELESLGVKQVFIIGGPAVISDGVKAALENIGISTTRIWGQDRYETSIKVAEQLDFKGEIFVANGESFADALSIAPIAAQKSAPVILTPPDTLPEYVNKYIENNKITKTYIIGENDVVSDNVANRFPNSERIWGSNRYDTNIAVLNKFKSNLDFSSIYLANGENFPDALSGSALATQNSSCVLLLNDSIGQSTKSFAFNELSSIKNMDVLGGNDVVSDNLVNKIVYPDNNSVLNLPKDAITVRQGDWIYFSSDSKGGAPLSKCKADGTSFMHLSEKYATNITIAGDWIYFTSTSSYLYRIKTDGTDETQLSNEHYRWFKVVDNKIYCSSPDSFTTMDMDGSNKLNVPVDGMIIDPDIAYNYFYYIEQSSAAPYMQKIYRMKTDGSDKVQISSEELYNIGRLKVYNNLVYFTVNTDNPFIQHLKKMNLNGTENTSIVDCFYNSFDISEDWIYYFTPDNHWLSKIKIDGSKNSQIADSGYYLSAIRDGWIYYFTVNGEATIQHKIRIDGTDDTILQ